MVATAEPVWPNAGVNAWYRGRLQDLVLAMSRDMLASIKVAWQDGGGIATDEAPRDGVGVIFRDSRGYILMLERSDGSGWGWPGGGLEPGETHTQAAYRECIEEMGSAALYFNWPDEPEVVNVQGGPVRYVTLLVESAAPFVPFLNHEHTDYRWLPVEAALALPLYPSIRSTLLTCGLQRGSDVTLGQDARPKPSTSLLLRRALGAWGTRWTRRIERVSDTIASDFAERNRSATERAMLAKLTKAGFAVKFKPNPAATAAFDAVVAENVGLIRSIPQKFLTDVQAMVWDAVMRGSDLATLATGIQEKYGVAWRRAELIATDQNAKAKSAMERARRKEVGIEQGIWQHSHAGKEPRPTHVAMNGKVYDLDTGMWDSDEQAYVWPGTLIRCRCSDRAVIPGFK